MNGKKAWHIAVMVVRCITLKIRVGTTLNIVAETIMNVIIFAMEANQTLVYMRKEMEAMRLIDADEMLDFLTAAFINAGANCDELTAKVNTAVHLKMTALINATPTAYDIDKVVRKLEERKEYQRRMAVDKSYMTGVLNGFNETIEIVKGGAV